MDTAVIRGRYSVDLDVPGWSCPACGQGVCDCGETQEVVVGLCDEVDALRARLAAVLALCESDPYNGFIPCMDVIAAARGEGSHD